ncbi:hypothetical protein WDU94_013198, partial [Cyamophila willieti]
SCIVTRVILNVSIALTVQCFKPDGSVYNKTICSMMPSNLAKLEILKDLFRETNTSTPHSVEMFHNNMSTTDPLETTPVMVLLEQLDKNPDNITDTDNEDVYLDQDKNKFKFRMQSPRMEESTDVRFYTTMKNESFEDDMAEVEQIHQITTKELEIELKNDDKSSFKTDSGDLCKTADNSNTTQDKNSILAENVYSNLNTEDKPESESKEKFNPTSDMINATMNIAIHQGSDETNDIMKIATQARSDELSTTTLSFHDQVALSLERYMKMIDENEDLGSYSKGDNNSTDFKNNTNLLRLSEELADYKNFLADLKHNKEYNATEGSENNIFENETHSTENFKNQFEKENERKNEKSDIISLEVKTEKEDGKSDNSLTDQYKTENNVMNHSRHLNPQDLTTRPYDGHNRIEKRSIPNTNSEFHEIDDHKTRLGKDCNDKTVSMSKDEKSQEEDKPILPGADRFWDFFQTSPVVVILNSTTIYEKAGLYNPEMKDYEKEHYDKVVKSLKEKQEIQCYEGTEDIKNHERLASVEHRKQITSVEHNKQHTSVEHNKQYTSVEYHKQQFSLEHHKQDNSIEYHKHHASIERKAKQNTIDTEQSKTLQNYGSGEIENLMGTLVNKSSLEKDIAYNLMDESKTKTTVDPRKRLSPEKYAEFSELKKSLDLQYKDLKEHMNKTDRHIERLFIEMRNLKEEKMLNDYFQENEHLFTHYSTPENYSNTIERCNIITEPYVNLSSSVNASDFMPDKMNERSSEEAGDGHQFECLDKFDEKHFSVTPDPEEEKERAEMEEHLRRLLVTTTMNTNDEMYKISRNTEKYDYESLERYDKKKFQEMLKMELEQKDGPLVNISKDHIEHIHANLMKRLYKTRPSSVQRTTIKPKTETPKLWFEESVFDQNDPKIVYAKYLHNIRNLTVRLNMEVGKKYIKNITYFNKEDRRYAHQYKSTTECRRFSHIIPFWLTQPKEIEDVFKGNTKIFREYIQYILDKHNFTELPVNGRFAFMRKYINKLNNPLIFNRITIFPTAYITTDHVLSLKDQIKHFKGHLKSKIHKTYKQVKHFLFNSSLDEAHDPVPITNTETIPDEVIINITTPPAVGPYYDYY